MKTSRVFWGATLLVILVIAGVSLSFNTNLPSKPENNRFTPVVLTPEGALDEPMMFQVLTDGTAYIIERKGGFKMLDPVTGVVSLIAKLPVYSGSEQGLVGLELDPNFTTNHWVYLLYAHLTEEKYLLERHQLIDNKLVAGSKKVLLEFHVDRNDVNHPAGGMCWDGQGNLYITTPNNSGNQNRAQVDERPGFFKRDDQRTSANTNDLRGKILRIHPEASGSYTIPKGNLFPVGTDPADRSKTRPEIYTMGHRNPWRVSIDSQTGWMYWGEIGPDKDIDAEDSPRGYDELNQAKGPGFFGWPYFIGNNSAYPMYDFANDSIGPKQDPAHPINKSPNNTGLNQLPPAQPALIWYPYAASEEFPLVGSSSRCAVGGPVYHRTDFKNPQRPFPAYYEGKWLAADLSRFWIMAITMDKNGKYQSMERFAPDYHPVQPIDLKFAPSGDLYVLEYGGNTSKSSVESKLVRVEYNAGNRKPFVQASATKRGGAVPFKTTLSSAGTKDFDGDALRYEWKLTGGGGKPQLFITPNPTVTFDKAGVYTATLTVTDAKGAKNSQSLRIVSGNEPPQVRMALQGNQTFFFDGSPLRYSVAVSDKEDGNLGESGATSGRIAPAQVSTSIDYASEGLDFVDIAMQHQLTDATTRYALAKTLMSRSDCNSCHTMTQKVIGPAWQQIAGKYGTENDAVDKLAKKIRTGGSGVWGESNMPAHPSISENDARTIVKFILNTISKAAPTLPVQGTYAVKIPADDNGRGTYILRAAYQDKPTKVPAQVGESVIVLRSPVLLPTKADAIGGGAVRDQLDDYIFLTTKPQSYIGYKHIDLTDVRQVEFKMNWHIYDIYRGGTIEVHLDSPTGELLGKADVDNMQFNLKTMGLWAFEPTSPKRKTAANATASPAPPASGHGSVVAMEAPKPNQMDSTARKRMSVLGGFFRLKDKNEFTKSSFVRLKETSGFHDLYFVFKNPKAAETESLFPLAWIKLSDTAQ